MRIHKERTEKDMKYVIYIRVGNKKQLDYIPKKTKTEANKKSKMKN